MVIILLTYYYQIKIICKLDAILSNRQLEQKSPQIRP